MLTAIVLLCAASGPCDRLVVPGEFASPVTCAMHGQSYIADTVLDMRGRTARVVCKPVKRG